MCDVLEIIIMPYHPGLNIIIVYFKHITHTVVITTHYKRMGYVIIPEPYFSSREARCCHFDLVLFRRFDIICRLYDRSCRRFDVWLAIKY